MNFNIDINDLMNQLATDLDWETFVYELDYDHKINLFMALLSNEDVRSKASQTLQELD